MHQQGCQTGKIKFSEFEKNKVTNSVELDYCTNVLLSQADTFLTCGQGSTWNETPDDSILFPIKF